MCLPDHEVISIGQHLHRLPCLTAIIGGKAMRPKDLALPVGLECRCPGAEKAAVGGGFYLSESYAVGVAPLPTLCKGRLEVQQ